VAVLQSSGLVEVSEGEPDRVLGSCRDVDPLDSRRSVERDDRPPKTPRERHLRKRAPAAPDRDDRVSGGGDGEVAGMADPGHDDMVGPLVRGATMLAREDGDRRATDGLRSSLSRGHHLAEAARDHGAAPLGEQAPDRLGGRLPLRAASDHRHLDGHGW
jgi:hypothetical protein